MLLMVQGWLSPEHFPLSRNEGQLALGLYIHAAKCELFSLSGLSMFPSMMKKSNVPHFEILGAPIGDAIFCAKFVSQNVQWPPSCSHRLEKVGSVDPQVAILLLHQCGVVLQTCTSGTIEAVSHTPYHQKDLSCKLEDSQFNKLSANSDRARLLSVSSPHAGAWLSVTPSPRLNLQLTLWNFEKLYSCD